jgi:glycosyltransferase involved in cell wall biosynthesis
MRPGDAGMEGAIALVAPRKMRFSPDGATSIDLHIHEVARWSAHADRIVVLAEEAETPFCDVAARTWPRGSGRRGPERLLRGAKPALIVVHQHLPTALWLALTCRSPVALMRHNYLKPPRPRLSAGLRRAGLAAIGFVSAACRDHYRAAWPAGGPPLFVIPNGVDCARHPPAAERAREVLFVGRLSPEKAVLESAEAVARTLAARPDWRARFILAVAGAERHYADAVRRALAPLGARAVWVEDAPHDAVRAAMARAAIVLAPSRVNEAFGRVGLEAMAGGAALISTNRPAIREVTGDAAILLESADAPALAEALDRLLDAPETQATLGRAGRERAAAFDLPAAASAFDRMVSAILSRPHD